MAVKQRTNKKGINLVLYFYVILILLLVLTVSSYTWFSLSKAPRVSNMTVYINMLAGLEISLEPDDGGWGQQLAYVDMVNEASPLRPITWSNEQQRFFAARYGMDGRLLSEWEPLSDERNANRDDADGYYCIATFYARSDDAMIVSLAPAVEVTEGARGAAGTYLIGTPEWDAEAISHSNAGKGAENAIRVGIQITRLDENAQPTDDPVLFYIYEPNADRHNDGSLMYVDTPSIDGTGTLIARDQLITQTASDWAEVDPIQKNVLQYQLGEFTSPTELFLIQENEMVQIRLYIWLEGMDSDCTNVIADAKITANIQFSAVSYNESGMGPGKDETDEKDENTNEETKTEDDSNTPSQ